MTETPEQSPHGAVLSRYHASHLRLLGIAAVGVLVAALVLLLTIPMMRSGYSYRYTSGIAFGLGVTAGGLTLGVMLSVVVALRGLSEIFEVRESGLTHQAKGRMRGWSWESVEAVNVIRPPRSTFLSRVISGDYNCVVRFADGQRIRFNGKLSGYGELEQAIRQHSATHDGSAAE